MTLLLANEITNTSSSVKDPRLNAFASGTTAKTFAQVYIYLLYCADLTNEFNQYLSNMPAYFQDAAPFINALESNSMCD